MASETQPEPQNSISQQDGEIENSPSHEENKDQEEPTIKVCRICLGEEFEEEAMAQGPLMRVCPCDGSIRYVHRGCILEWISATGDRMCPTCKAQVECTMKFKPLSQWDLLRLPSRLDEFGNVICAMEEFLKIAVHCFAICVLFSILAMRLMSFDLSFDNILHFIFGCHWSHVMYRMFQRSKVMVYWRRLLAANNMIIVKPFEGN